MYPTDHLIFQAGGMYTYIMVCLTEYKYDLVSMRLK